MLAITDHSGQRLALAVERFGRSKPDRLEFIRLEFQRAQRDLSRDPFCDGLGRLLAEQFPDESFHQARSGTLFLMSGFSRNFLPCEISCPELPPHSRITLTSGREHRLNFSATIRHTPQASLIDLRGRLTFFEVGVLRENITRLLGEGHKNIVLNLSGLQYLDSSGIGELARMYVMVLKGGGEMKVVGLSRNVEEVLKVTHLYQVFPEFPDEEAALKSFPASRTDKSGGTT